MRGLQINGAFKFKFKEKNRDFKTFKSNFEIQRTFKNYTGKLY